MLPENHMPGGSVLRGGVAWAWAGWLVIAVVGSLMGPVDAQAQAGAGPGEMIDAPLVDASHALRAHRQVEDWLALGEASLEKADPIRVTGLFGVRMTLRIEGFEVGQGQAYRSAILSGGGAWEGAEAGGAVDLLPMLAQATEQAMAGVRQSLTDAQVRGLVQQRPQHEPKVLTVAEVSQRVVIELELGYGMQPVRVPADAGPDEVYARFAPSYHGLGFVGSRPGSVSFVWPGEAIARNISPSSQVVLGLKRLSLDRSLAPGVARPDGVKLFRFQTHHLARPVSDMRPTVLIRGNADLPRFALSDHALESLGDRLVEHLFARLTSDGQVRGTYHPTSGRFEPQIAPDDQAALVCFALMRHSRYLHSARPGDLASEIFVERSLRVVTRLGLKSLEAGDAADPRVLALVLLALVETPAGEGDKDLRDRLGARLVSLVKARGSGAGGQAPPSDASAALMTAALGSWYAQTRQAALGEVVWAQLQHLWGGQRPPNLSALPWLALTDELAGGVLAEADPTGKRAEALAQRRDRVAQVIGRLCQRQVIEHPVLGPDDVLGGFVLTPGPAGSPPNPDWRNAQPLMLIAIALRDPAATQDRDKLGWLLTCGYAARFTGQLMMDEVNSYYVRDRSAALGGVRMALWDNRLALAPSAMSLLAVTELQQTLWSLKPAPVVDQADSSDEADAQEDDPADVPDVERGAGDHQPDLPAVDPG